MTENIIFKNLSSDSKVWIYPANRVFTAADLNTVNTTLDEFVTSWKSHGSALSGSYEILFNQFIILAIDDAGASASGCSIDSSVKVIKLLEEKLQLTLMDRALVSYEKNGIIQQISFTKIKEAIQQGEIQADTIIFDNSVITLEDFHAKWRKIAKESWVSRFFH